MKVCTFPEIGSRTYAFSSHFFTKMVLRKNDIKEKSFFSTIVRKSTKVKSFFKKGKKVGKCASGGGEICIRRKTINFKADPFKVMSVKN